MRPRLQCAVFGAGAWGTAIALHLSREGHCATLVPRRLEQALSLLNDRENRARLPGISLPPALQIAAEPAPALAMADVVFLASPSQNLRALAESLAPHIARLQKKPVVIALCKGFELKTQLPPSAVIAQTLPECACGTLSGPSNAAEVAEGKPTALALAYRGGEAMRARFSELCALLSGARLRIYLNGDIAGVELGGALKNVYAVGAGICDGMRLGDNARAAYLTRCLAEMARVGVALGGKLETFYGLSGVGDLAATCGGKWSRNRAFGERLARGEAQEAPNGGGVVEGVAAVRCFCALCRERGIDAPILEGVYAVVCEGASPAERLGALMARGLKAEV